MTENRWYEIGVMLDASMFVAASSEKEAIKLAVERAEKGDFHQYDSLTVRSCGGLEPVTYGIYEVQAEGEFEVPKGERS